MKYLTLGVLVTIVAYGTSEEVDADQLRCLGKIISLFFSNSFLREPRLMGRLNRRKI